MKVLLAIGALAAAAAAGPSATDAAAPKPAHRPSAVQIRAAVRRAQRSRNLWATINICNTKHYRHVIGIRGQMPALGFETSLSMEIQVDYWNVAEKRFVADPGVKLPVALGRATNGLYQGGVSFRFDPPADLSGQVSFTWKLAGKVIGHAHRTTHGGLKHVDFGDPRGHSATTCRINS